MELTQAEIDAARKWWRELKDVHKGNQSIWVLLAMYARYVLDQKG